MSPHYKEVFVPDEAQEQFETHVIGLGGYFLANLEHTVYISDIDKLWAREAAIARSLCSRFELARFNPDMKENVRNGVKTLMREAWRNHAKYRRQLPQANEEGLDWDRVEVDLLSYFNTSIPESVPRGIHLNRNNHGTFLAHSKDKIVVSDDTLLPSQVISIIERFGLADGMPKYISEIQEKYGFRPQAPLHEGLNKIARNV